MGADTVAANTVPYKSQNCPLKTSHPNHLPQSPNVCSVHLCLFFFFAYRVMVTQGSPNGKQCDKLFKGTKMKTSEPETGIWKS